MRARSANFELDRTPAAHATTNLYRPVSLRPAFYAVRMNRGSWTFECTAHHGTTLVSGCYVKHSVDDSGAVAHAA